MRILGDLDGDRSPEPRDSSGTREHGNHGNYQAVNSSPASGGETAQTDEQTVDPREQTDFTEPRPEDDRRNDFIGGVPPAHPPAPPRADADPGNRVSDRLGEQRLETADDIHNRALPAPQRSNGGLWFVLMVLLFALVGASGYLYLALRNNNVPLSQVPQLLQSIPVLGSRIDSTEAKLRDLTGNWDGLTNQLAELDHRIDSSLRATRNQTRELVGQAAGRLQAEMDQRGQVMDARLNNVESMQRQDRAQLAQLNDQLRGQVASLHEQLAATQESTGRDLANMQEQVSNNDNHLHTLAQQLHRDTVTFEIVKNSPTELAPGVTLTVLKTDVSFQRFRGYISLTKEGKTLWLNDLSAKEAVDLYSQSNSHPYSLVVTTVNHDGVVGYLLLPAGA